MRIWTLHPRYLDTPGLLAAWREALGAQAVLAGQTRGYRHHPQLRRFREQADPLAAVAAYLAGLYAEGVRRGYRFDASKIPGTAPALRMVETEGQLLYEWRLLLQKLEARSPSLHAQWRATEVPEPHPVFCIVPGGIRDWEKPRPELVERQA